MPAVDRCNTYCVTEYLKDLAKAEKSKELAKDRAMKRSNKWDALAEFEAIVAGARNIISLYGETPEDGACAPLLFALTRLKAVGCPRSGRVGRSMDDVRLCFCSL